VLGKKFIQPAKSSIAGKRGTYSVFRPCGLAAQRGDHTKKAKIDQRNQE
jgi:hypothetical protein